MQDHETTFHSEHTSVQTELELQHGDLHGRVFPEQLQDSTCSTRKVRTAETHGFIKHYLLSLNLFNAHELKILCCFQMRSYVFGKKVWQQFGEAEICSWRVSSERHPLLRSSGEGRVFHHPQTSFTFPWRLLQIFPWHPTSFPGSLRGCSSVVLGRMNITWKTLHTNHS